jgi:hypothetical protein
MGSSVHHFTPNAKERSEQWTETGELASKKAKTVSSAGKVMASVFWDVRGIIFIDYLQIRKTINSEYYANLLRRLSDEIKKKRLHLTKKKCCFIKTMHQLIHPLFRWAKSIS